VKINRETIRTRAKANAVFLSGSTSSINQFLTEQESARGNFPGPVPVIYCYSNENDKEEDLKEIPNADGIFVSYPSNQEPIRSAEDLDKIAASGSEFYSKVKNQGMAYIPEICLHAGIEWDNEDLIQTVIDAVKTKICNGDSPAGIVFNVPLDLDKDQTELKLPSVPKSYTKREKIAVLGSVAVPAGENRLNECISRLKSKKYAGALLRKECVPGRNLDLEFIGKFWSACISDLKSTRSKSFGFRAKVNVKLEKDLPSEWIKLQKSVLESGALGEQAGGMEGLNTDAGDYAGF